jgi:hypothetical protein
MSDIEILECENCNFQSRNEDDFEVGYIPMAGDVLYCRDCSCCSQCRELIRR